MVVLDEMTLHRYFVLCEDEANEICNGWISDKQKMQLISYSDGRPVSKIIRDAVTGMTGEWGSYLYVSGHDILCERPQCGVMRRDAEIWNKDLMASEPFRIYRADGKSHVVDQSISCKAQLMSQAQRLGASWTFQRETSDRHGDPMLDDPSCNKVLVVSLVDDFFNDREVSFSYLDKAHEKGFCWQLHVTCFWWPDVFPYLSLPKRSDLRDKKKCLYLKDIQHLQSRIVVKDDFYDFS